MTRAHRLMSRLAARASPFKLPAVSDLISARRFVIRLTLPASVTCITSESSARRSSAKLATLLGRPVGLPL